MPTSCIAGSHHLSDFADYGFVLSPNQTPYRDMYFLEKLLGLGVDDGVQVNTVFTRLCWLMGVWPAVYASLLLPTAKSGNKVFPFTALLACIVSTASSSACCTHATAIFSDIALPAQVGIVAVLQTNRKRSACRCLLGLLWWALLLLASLPWGPSLLCGHL